MPPPRPDASQKAILQQLLGNDAELQSYARQLVVLGMREMVNVMQRGDPKDRVAIARSLAGVITRPLMEDAGDDVAGELAVEMRQMMAEVRGDWITERVVEAEGAEGAEVATDAPRGRAKGQRA